MSTVRIHYRRLPDREQIFEQEVVAESAAYTVTFLAEAPLARPVRVGEREVLQPGAPVVWLTYPGRGYDVGRFHLRDGTFTGLYANVLTPVVMQGARWDTTDLCLDVWAGADGRVEVLDEAELDEAQANGWIGAADADAARALAASLAADARAGRWPEPHVHRWTLDRARAQLAAARTTPSPDPDR